MEVSEAYFEFPLNNGAKLPRETAEWGAFTP